MNRIVIVIKNLDGGTGTFLTQILKLKGFDFRVCALEKPRFGTAKFKNCYFFSKKPFHLASYGLNPLLYLRVIREFFWLQKIVRSEKPKLLLSIDTHCNILATSQKVFRTDLKILITNHNNVSAVVERKIIRPMRPILKSAGRYLFNKADKIACNSEGVAKDFKRFFSIKKKTEVIHYGLNLAEVQRLASKPIPNSDNKLFDDKKLRIISIGRFEEQKDFETLIRAFKKICDSKEADLILIGDGSKKQELKDLVRSLNLGKNVHFLGWRLNVFPYIRATDVFVLSSNYEGFGYVLLEAMACGVPVVSTDSPYGPREVLGDGKYGTLIKKGNVRQMKEVILKVLNSNSDHKNYAEKFRSRLDFFSEQKMLADYKSLVRNLL